jgi:hypothetical protein
MTEDTADKARKAFWGIALIGFLLPWIVIISCEIYFGGAADIRNFPSQLFASGYNYFLLALMDATPFIILAVAARLLLQAGQERQSRRGRLAGLGTAAACAMGSEFVRSDRRLELLVQSAGSCFACRPGYFPAFLLWLWRCFRLVTCWVGRQAEVFDFVDT